MLARRIHQLELPALATSALTTRQRQVLSLVAEGLTDTAVGHQLGCSPRTVDKHLEHIYRRLGVPSRSSATAVWVRQQHQVAHPDHRTVRAH